MLRHWEAPRSLQSRPAHPLFGPAPGFAAEKTVEKVSAFRILIALRLRQFAESEPSFQARISGPFGEGAVRDPEQHYYRGANHQGTLCGAQRRRFLAGLA